MVDIRGKNDGGPSLGDDGARNAAITTSPGLNVPALQT
jgi:hypothetical protein